jgi:hypothetical protein
MKPSMLLHMGKLLKPAIAVRAFVGLFARVHPNVLNELMIRRKRLQTLLALVRLDVVSAVRGIASSRAARARHAAHAAHAVVVVACCPRAHVAGLAVVAEVAAVKVHGSLGHQVLKTKEKETLFYRTFFSESFTRLFRNLSTFSLRCYYFQTFFRCHLLPGERIECADFLAVTPVFVFLCQFILFNLADC